MAAAAAPPAGSHSYISVAAETKCFFNPVSLINCGCRRNIYRPNKVYSFYIFSNNQLVCVCVNVRDINIYLMEILGF